MQKLLVIGALAMLAWGTGDANAAGNGPFWPFTPTYWSDAPYFPEVRPYPWAGREAECVRWNWQQLSYYNYCGTPGSIAPRGASRGALRVRD